MLTSTQLKQLARACRALAYKLEQDAEVHKRTSAHPAALAEIRYFRDLAEECERLARSAPAE